MRSSTLPGSWGSGDSGSSRCSRFASMIFAMASV